MLDPIKYSAVEVLPGVAAYKFARFVQRSCGEKPFQVMLADTKAAGSAQRGGQKEH